MLRQEDYEFELSLALKTLLKYKVHESEVAWLGSWDG
jgi:hypothetical protein